LENTILTDNPLRLLINLPPTFFTQPQLQPYFDRLSEIASLRWTSHNTQEELAPDLAWAEAIFMWALPILDDALLDHAPNLRFVGQINTKRSSAETCLRRGLALSETRHCWSPAVAEMALTLMLADRQTSAYHAAMRQVPAYRFRRH
jgi:phosphoglycerate dehydrogenase-like enzyme